MAIQYIYSSLNSPRAAIPLPRFRTPKPVHMAMLKINQLQYESDTWKRVLGFMTEENINLKNRLSEVLKLKADKNLLAEAESFQNSFLREDTLIGLLRNDIAEFDKRLARSKAEDGVFVRELEGKLRHIRNDIHAAEKEFGKLKMDFNSYLFEIA